MLETAKAFMVMAVAPGTRASNLAALAIWQEFRHKATDSFGLFLEDAMNRRDAILELLRFIVWAIKERGLTPNATKTLFGKLRWNFTCNAGDSTLFDNPSVRTTIKGLVVSNSPSLADLKKSPNSALLWVLELNDSARELFWVSQGQDERMAYIGSSLAFNFSLRIGEIANVGPYNQSPKFTPDHRFYWCDIILESEEIDFTFGEFKAVSPRPSIVLITFVKLSSKTSGRASPDGKPYYLTRGSVQEERLLDDFLIWIEECNHTNETYPITSRIHPSTGLYLDLQSKAVCTMMNSVGERYDLKGFSGKSLRGGGSSSLSAAGYSDSVILNSVGHKSLSSNQHYQSGTASGNAYAMGAGNTISIRDVKRVSKVVNLNQSRSKRSKA